MAKLNNDNPIWQTEEGKYFTEIEHYFSRKRAFPTLLTAKEWFLVQSWWEEGIPLSIIKRAIDSIAQKIDCSERKISLFYCKSEVLKEWKSYKRAITSTTASAADEPAFSISINRVQEHVDTLIRMLETIIQEAPAEYQSLCDVFKKQISALRKLKAKYVKDSINAEEYDTIETALCTMEQSMMKKIVKKLPDSVFNEILLEAKQTLSQHRAVISQVAYEQTLQNFIRKTLMKILHVPRFSMYNELLSRTTPGEEQR
jgi:hypothetical protein